MWLVCALASGSGAQAAHAMWVAEGLVNCQILTVDGKTNFEQAWTFSVYGEDAGPWKMMLETTFPSARLPIKTREILGFDGTNIYSVVYSSNRIDMSGGTVKIVAGDDHYPGQVCPGPYPVDYSSTVGFLWFAFFGGQHLEATNSRARFPNLLVTDARRDPMAWICDLDYSLTNLTGGALVNRAQFIANKNYLAKDSLDYPNLDEPEIPEQNSLFETQVQQYGDLKNEELARSTYELEELASASKGVFFPRRFTCFNSPLPSRPDLRGCLFNGEVTNFSESRQTSVMPEIIGTLTVEDRRARVKEKATGKWRRDVYYSLGDQGWITDTNDPVFQAAVAQKPLFARISFAGSAVPRRIVLFFLILAAVAPVLVKLFLSRKGGADGREATRMNTH